MCTAGSNFAPTGADKLQCSFGLNVVVAAEYESVELVRCSVPLKALSGESVVVHVRHDGVHWSAHGERLMVYNSSKPPQVHCTAVLLDT